MLKMMVMMVMLMTLLMMVMMVMMVTMVTMMPSEMCRLSLGTYYYICTFFEEHCLLIMVVVRKS